jgi:hypothetical protein
MCAKGAQSQQHRRQGQKPGTTKEEHRRKVVTKIGHSGERKDADEG